MKSVFEFPSGKFVICLPTGGFGIPSVTPVSHGSIKTGCFFLFSAVLFGTALSYRNFMKRE